MIGGSEECITQQIISKEWMFSLSCKDSVLNTNEKGCFSKTNSYGESILGKIFIMSLFSQKHKHLNVSSIKVLIAVCLTS